MASGEFCGERLHELRTGVLGVFPALFPFHLTGFHRLRREPHWMMDYRAARLFLSAQA